jgi:hypothetical protein
MAVFSTLAIIGTLASLAVTVASIAYQRKKAKKLKDELDKRKQVNFSYDGEPFYLSVAYGRCKINGGRTIHRLRNSFVFAQPSLPYRVPTTGDYYDTNYYIRERVRRVNIGVGSNFRDRTHEIEIKWAGSVVLTRPNVSPLDVFADGAGNKYYKGDLALTQDTGGGVDVEGGYTDNYYRVHVVGPGQAQIFYWPNGGVNFAGSIGAIIKNLLSGLGIGSMSGNLGGDKAEFLYVQQALCFGGINRVIDVEVDDQIWNEPKLQYGQRIHVYKNGNVADSMASANGIPSTNVFTNTCYSSSVFRLNRDEYQYNGSPNVIFYVEGMRVYDIVDLGGGSYGLSSEKVYSNNPALVLLDYLLSTNYGLKLSVNQVNLETFYKAKAICNRVVRNSIPVDGKVNGRRPDIENEDGSVTTSPAIPNRAMPLYECNIVLDTERAIRENVELILESMPGSELIWSGGVYKLSLIAPRTSEELQDLIAANLTSADIIKGQVDLAWPDSNSRYNQVVARFRNEFENFTDDTVTWPLSYSPVYNAYLEEDSGKLLKTEVYLPAVTDPYHALAVAEELVRTSRASMTVKCTVGKKGLFLEPGDIVTITSDVLGLNDEILRVNSVTLSSNMTAELELTEFDLNTLAWNVDDNIAFLPKFLFSRAVTKPAAALFTPNPQGDVVPGVLSWDLVPEITISDYVLEYAITPEPGFEPVWQILGTKNSSPYSLQPLPTGWYRFAVTSREDYRYRSSRVVATGADLVTIDFYIVNPDDVKYATIYGDSGDELTNNQSLGILGMSHVAYYRYLVDFPTLPVRENIVFTPLYGPGAPPLSEVEPPPPDPGRTEAGTFYLTISDSIAGWVGSVNVDTGEAATEGVDMGFAAAVPIEYVVGDVLIVEGTDGTGGALVRSWTYVGLDTLGNDAFEEL